MGTEALQGQGWAAGAGLGSSTVSGTRGSCTHERAVSGWSTPAMPAVLPPQPRTAHTAGARSPFLSGPAPLIASKMHKNEKKKSHWGCAAAGLASVQLRRSISCCLR